MLADLSLLTADMSRLHVSMPVHDHEAKFIKPSKRVRNGAREREREGRRDGGWREGGGGAEEEKSRQWHGEGERVRLSERVTESERVRVTVTSVENIESK